MAAPLIPAFRSQRQVDLWIGSKPGLHREVQDSWVFLGPVSKNKRKVLLFCPEQQMNLTWPSLKNGSHVVRTDIRRWSLVPSEKGLLASVSGKGGGGCLFSIPWYLLPGSGDTHTSRGSSQKPDLNSWSKSPLLTSTLEAYLTLKEWRFGFHWCSFPFVFFLKPWQFSYLVLFHIFNPMRLICSLLNKETIASSCWGLSFLLFLVLWGGVGMKAFTASESLYHKWYGFPLAIVTDSS